LVDLLSYLMNEVIYKMIRKDRSQIPKCYDLEKKQELLDSLIDWWRKIQRKRNESDEEIHDQQRARI